MCTLGSHPATGFPSGHASSRRTRTTTTKNSGRAVTGSKWGVRMHSARPRPAASLEEPCSTPPPLAPFRRCLLPGSGWPACAWGCWPTPSSGGPSPSWPATASSRLKLTTAAVTFVLSALLAWRFGSAAELPAYVVLGVFAVPLARIDIVHHLLPNRLVGPLLAAGLALLAFAALAQGAAWGPVSRSRRVRNLVHFVPDFGTDQR